MRVFHDQLHDHGLTLTLLILFLAQVNIYVSFGYPRQRTQSSVLRKIFCRFGGVR